MFEQLLAKFHSYEIAYRDEVIETRRRFLRHDGMQAEVMLAGRPYALHDWSLGGALFETPNADWNTGEVYFDRNPVPRLKKGDKVKLALRFHIFDRTLEIPVEGTISRMDARGTVAHFGDLAPATRKQFAKLTDLYNARDFLESQAGRGQNDNDFFG